MPTLIKNLIILTIFVLFTTKVQAQSEFEKRPLLLIVDFSGSMNTKYADSPRIMIAKEAVQKLFADFPMQARVGLMLYGHRRAKDCSDIEVVEQIAAAEPTRLNTISNKINKLKARGETPIAESLQQSISVFAGEPGRILMVTDGKEECGGNVCEVADHLAAAGVKLQVDIVGFGLTESQRDSLSCITSKTGGKFYNATSAEDLIAALRSSTEEALGAGRLRVTVTEGGKVMTQVPIITLYQNGNLFKSLDRNPSDTLIPAGTYQLSATVGPETSSDPIEVTVEEGKISEHVIELGTGVVSVTLKKGSNSNFQRRPGTQLLKLGTLVATSYEQPARFQVPACACNLKVTLNSLQTFDAGVVEVRAGETLQPVIQVPMAEVKVQVQGGRYAPGRGPFPYLQIYKDGQFLTAMSDNPAIFQLLEGEYEIQVHENSVVTISRKINVVAGVDQDITLTPEK